MKRNAFGQLGPQFAPSFHRPFLRYFAPVEGEGGGGENGGENGGGKEFKAPQSQEELDRIVTDRASRAERRARDEERAKYADYDSLKSDAEKFRAANAKQAPKTDDAPKPVSEDDVDKRINDALAAERLELALERVNDSLDKALEGRTYPASKLFAVDRKQFVKEDGKTVDTDALKEWVDKNSTAVEQTDPRRRPIPGQGKRDDNASGGSVQSGRDLYDETHKKKSRKD